MWLKYRKTLSWLKIHNIDTIDYRKIQVNKVETSKKKTQLKQQIKSINKHGNLTNQQRCKQNFL